MIERTRLPELLDRIVPLAALLLLVLLNGSGIGPSAQRFTGITGSTQKNGYGCYCHTPDPSPFVTVWIEGPDTLYAGDEAVYSVHVARDSSRTAGFNVAVNEGVLDVVDSSEVYWYEDELTHTEPKLAAGRDTISWQFLYTAPDSLLRIIDTIYSAGNSTNQDTLPNEGDLWAFGERFVVVVLGSPTSVEPSERPAAFRLHQNYPNPFNPATTIRFSLSEESEVSLTAFDAAGRFVGDLAGGRFIPGDHDVVFQTNEKALSSGVYFYRLMSRSVSSGKLRSATRKMVLLR